MTITYEQQVERAKDQPWNDGYIKELKDLGDSWEFGVQEPRWGDGVSAGFIRKKTEFPVEPQIGDHIAVYTVRGSTIRGIDINGVPAFYKSQEELDEEHRLWCEDLHKRRLREFEEQKAQMDADYEALPQVFKDRIDGFRAANPEFRVEYERYEMFCCTEAVKFAEAARKAVDEHLHDAEVDAFYADPEKLELAAYGSDVKTVVEPKNPYIRWLMWAQAVHSKAYDYDFHRQQELLGTEDGHSGNTFGAAMYMAKVYIDAPEWVDAVHGALAPLVGCKEYGCVHEGDDDE